ncbi:MAG: helix-turn-helix domain-containing protein [Peptostreptococcaceae bacterium]|nr:helix-turn-helix domain-containing protein [Peptostreptococcaceae bacterium]
MINDYFTIKEAANNWGLTQRWVRTLCAEGKIEGSGRFGKVWVIPQTAEHPTNGRVTTGAYKNWRGMVWSGIFLEMAMGK